MKEKKSTKFRKFILMGVACVLVAAMSVSATMAYLTAQTKNKVNSFSPTGGLKGQLIEPSWEQVDNFLPGKSYPKDPSVDNDTTDSKIYAAMKLEFQIWASDENSNEGYVTVPYNVFKEFVTIEGLDTINNKTAVSSSSPENEWYPMTVNGANTNYKYYFYNAILAKDQGDGNDVGNPANNDVTAPLFRNVTVNSKLRLQEGGTAFTKSLFTAGSENTAVVNAAAAVTACTSNPSTAYSAFKFRIKCTGYGTKYEDSSTTATVAEGYLKNIITSKNPAA